VCKGVVQSLGGREGAIVKDCRGIGRMGVRRKIGITDYSVNGGKVRGGQKDKKRK
jgi:hypothetical protein